MFDCSLDQKDMHGETPYEIMFGKFLYQNYAADNDNRTPSLRVTGHTSV